MVVAPQNFFQVVSLQGLEGWNRREYVGRPPCPPKADLAVLGGFSLLPSFACGKPSRRQGCASLATAGEVVRRHLDRLGDTEGLADRQGLDVRREPVEEQHAVALAVLRHDSKVQSALGVCPARRNSRKRRRSSSLAFFPPFLKVLYWGLVRLIIGAVAGASRAASASESLASPSGVRTRPPSATSVERAKRESRPTPLSNTVLLTRRSTSSLSLPRRALRSIVLSLGVVSHLMV